MDDVAVDNVRQLGHGVLLRAKELKGLAGRAVVVGDGLQGLADVDNVHGAEALRHVVGREEVGDAGELEEEAVFEAEHGRGAHDRGFGEDEACVFFGAALRGG